MLGSWAADCTAPRAANRIVLEQRPATPADDRFACSIADRASRIHVDTRMIAEHSTNMYGLFVICF